MKKSKAKNQSQERELYYDEAKLYKKSSPKVFSITSFPLEEAGETLAVTEANSVQPGGTITWYLNGPAGTQFTNRVSFEGGGGHSHGVGSADPVAAGTITPPSGVIQGQYPQNIRITFRAGEVCGQVRFVAVVGSQTFVNMITVALGGFQSLSATTGVVLVGSTTTHSDNHWGTPSLCAAIGRLGAAFYQQFRSPIYVNDMSLISGGLLDIHGNFRTPHITHRDGRHVDMNWSSMTPQQRTWFKAKAEEIGFAVELHENPTHWHLRFG
jgi:hypothetical protein